jgi:uncharacterized membrane protein (DUF485 family)
MNWFLLACFVMPYDYFLELTVYLCPVLAMDVFANAGHTCGYCFCYALILLSLLISDAMSGFCLDT